MKFNEQRGCGVVVLSDAAATAEPTETASHPSWGARREGSPLLSVIVPVTRPVQPQSPQ